MKSALQLYAVLLLLLDLRYDFLNSEALYIILREVLQELTSWIWGFAIRRSL